MSNYDHSLWLTQLRPDLVRYCRSLCGNTDEAEDLAQEIIIKMMDRFCSESGFEPSRSYVFRSARNLWIDWCRKKSRQSTLSLDEMPTELVDRPESDAMNTRELLEQLMHRLLPKPFVILLLCEVFKFTAKETALCIHMAEVAVQVALSRARKRLRQLAMRESEETTKVSRPSQSATDIRQLLDAVTEAFRRHDPHLIHDAYMRLFESGTQLAAIRKHAGKLYFTFYDPDGNMLMVTE